MSSDLRTLAEIRLTEAAAALGLDDPRDPLRHRLKLLRETQPDVFASAVDHYEKNVLPTLASDDALTVWLEYAKFIGRLTSGGSLVAIDATGRAAPFRPPPRPGDLVLFMPDETGGEIFVAAAPLAPTSAQQASIDLLVNRRLGMGSRSD
ncbi:hypothetical protein BH23GEM9_BH23GEM9_01940 [soil metagenome]